MRESGIFKVQPEGRLDHVMCLVVTEDGKLLIPMQESRISFGDPRFMRPVTLESGLLAETQLRNIARSIIDLCPLQEVHVLLGERGPNLNTYDRPTGDREMVNIFIIDGSINDAVEGYLHLTLEELRAKVESNPRLSYIFNDPYLEEALMDHLDRRGEHEIRKAS